ncbi:MAG: phosphatidate cytidylyltransferase [Candidatus Heimdallarchaeota archaeon]|nr:phosphatidate cytidylyltransferase [Candidatus Heimdallarchaeota archaeon]
MAEIAFFNGNTVLQDITMVVLTIVAIQVFIMINDIIKKKQLLSTTVTRKFIHIVAAPIYVFMWVFYSSSSSSKYIAIIVPSLFAIQFTLIGLGIMKNEPFVQTMSRSGNPKELLRGTLFYAIVMIILTLLFFIDTPITSNSNPVALIAFMTLAFGDGFADIVGRSVDKMKFKVFSEKSIPGSMAMLIGSILGSYLGLVIFGFSLSDYFTMILVICVIATIIEAISPKETDNITIPLVVVILSFI